MTIWMVLGAVVLVMGYIRLAPSNPKHWHVVPEVSKNIDFKDGVKLMVEVGQAEKDGLARFDAIVLTSARTRVLAGSVAAGMVTYITRSRLFGFPDYTTVRQDGGYLQIHARLRFGRSDFGVNRARVNAWVDAFHP